MILDPTDLSLVAALEAEGRKSFAALADEVGLSKTPCWNRIQALEKAGVVTSYGAHVDPRALGLGVRAYIEVMIDTLKMADFEQAVLRSPYILDCHTTAGSADYILTVICHDVDALDEILRFSVSVLPGLQRSNTMICLKSIKNGGSIAAAAADSARRRQK